MPKSEGQKLKLLYLADLLRREKDEAQEHTMSDILSRLEELGVHAERKSIYDDLRALEDYQSDTVLKIEVSIMNSVVVSTEYVIDRIIG